MRPATTSASCSAAWKKTTSSAARFGQAGLDHPAHEVQGQVYILTKEEGGRHTPFFNGYRPQFYVRTTDVTGTLHLPEGVEMVMPGDNTEISGELMAPVALEKGARFAIREGGRTVGSGTVTDIVGSKLLSMREMRDIVTMACTECKRRNYSTTKNKKKTTERLEFSKFCRFCRKHTAHKESK